MIVGKEEMTELTGRITDMSLDFTTGKPKLQLEINEKQAAFAMFEELKGCEKLSLKVGKFREKRSLDANRYFWKLCGLLAEKMSDRVERYTKEDVYLKAIRDVGVWQDDIVEPDKTKWRCEAWRQIGLGWVTERVDFTPDGSKEVIRFYYGSSRYNKKQMSRLIDNVVQDCHALGIETKTPEEIASLISQWGDEQ